MLTLLARGWSNRSIARELSIAEVTVRTHVSRILDKLGVSNRVEAVRQRDSDVAGVGVAGKIAAFHHQFSGGGAFRNAHDDHGVRPDHDRRGHVADGDARPVCAGKALAADLQLPAGDRGARGHLGDLRFSVPRSTYGHTSIKIQASRQK